ncbi:MAG: heme NO-binding domain-containing protein [Pseudomonadota bacterium]
MIGTIFVEFLEFVEEKYGLDTVDVIVEHARDSLSTNGSYTAVGNYAHDELLALAVAIHEVESTSINTIIHDFARHLMDYFVDKHGLYFAASNDVYEFLLSVGNIIHADVRKLYPKAQPPEITGSLNEESELLITYRSKRPLAELALALTGFAGDVFDQPLSIDVLERDEDGRRIVMKVRKAA